MMFDCFLEGMVCNVGQHVMSPLTPQMLEYIQRPFINTRKEWCAMPVNISCHR
uniref:Uncharacterized protein n=1 Tax=Helianthus annuus TaxID=4232 RepID=A0A251TYM2_HELAN